MSFCIPDVITNPGDLQKIQVAAYQKQTFVKNGVAQTVTLTPPQAQTLAAKRLVAANKRSVTKQITILITATSTTPTAMVGDAFVAAGETYVDLNTTWITQTSASGGSGSKSAAAKAAFFNMVRAQPFKFLGIQIDVSAASVFTAATWTEVITDYDMPVQTKDWGTTVNYGLNTFAQTLTTRFLQVGGEFNGNWGIFIGGGLASGNTVKFTFNCVDIDRSW